MIEVLLAVVVLAVGLLAGSKMQMLGLNYTQGAQYRTNATLAANDIIDRMRVNTAGVAAGAYKDKSTESPPANPACIDQPAGCTASQLADHDLRAWAAYFGKLGGANTTTPLAGATGTIDYDETEDLYTVKVEWEELIEGVAKERSVDIGVTF